MSMKQLAGVAVLLLCVGVSRGEPRDLTYIVASDLHYYGTNVNTRIQAHIDRMNALPGTAYPEAMGGVVGKIKGVVLNGDLTNNGTQEQWELFANDWGLTGERRCKYPLYEGLGNHDFYSGDILISNVVQRTRSRPGVLNVSSNGLHYSWEWCGIHFIQANMVPEEDARSRGALTFLREDLAKHVGASGKPVIVNLHISPVIDRDWPFERQKALLEALAPYHVLGIFCGHSHGYIHRKEDGKRAPDPDYEFRKFPGSSLDLYDDGSLRDCGARPKWKDSGRFLVVRITDTNMTVVMNTPQGWGVPHTKTLSSK